jgi:hypothetical protein
MSTRRKIYSEDLLFDGLVPEEGHPSRILPQKHLIHVSQITRIALGMERKNTTLVFLSGEEYPITADCEFETFSALLLEARQNQIKNSL